MVVSTAYALALLATVVASDANTVNSSTILYEGVSSSSSISEYDSDLSSSGFSPIIAKVTSSLVRNASLPLYEEQDDQGSTERTVLTPVWYEQEQPWYPTRSLHYPTNVHYSHITSVPQYEEYRPSTANVSTKLPSYEKEQAWHRPNTTEPPKYYQNTSLLQHEDFQFSTKNVSELTWYGAASWRLPRPTPYNPYLASSSVDLPTEGRSNFTEAPVVTAQWSAPTPTTSWIWREDAKPSFVTMNVTVTATVEGSSAAVSVVPIVSVSIPAVPLVYSLEDLVTDNDTLPDSNATNPKALFTSEEYQTLQEGIDNLDQSLILPEGATGECQPLPDDPCVNGTAIMQDPQFQEAIHQPDPQSQAQSDVQSLDHKEEPSSQADQDKVATIIAATSFGVGIPASMALGMRMYTNSEKIWLKMGGIMRARLPPVVTNNLQRILPFNLLHKMDLPRETQIRFLKSQDKLDPLIYNHPWEWPFYTPRVQANNPGGGGGGGGVVGGGGGGGGAVAAPPGPGIFPPLPPNPVGPFPPPPAGPPPADDPSRVYLPKSPIPDRGKTRTRKIPELDLGESLIPWNGYPDWRGQEDDPTSPLNTKEMIRWADAIIQQHLEEQAEKKKQKKQIMTILDLVEAMLDGAADLPDSPPTSLSGSSSPPPPPPPTTENLPQIPAMPDPATAGPLETLNALGPRIESITQELKYYRWKYGRNGGTLAPPHGDPSNLSLASQEALLKSFEKTLVSEQKIAQTTRQHLNECNAKYTRLAKQDHKRLDQLDKLRQDLSHANEKTHQCKQKTSCNDLRAGRVCCWE